MKSKRRHELQHNALADWLIKTGKTLAPYQNHITWGVVIVLVVIAVWMVWNKTTGSRMAAAWAQFGRGLDERNIEQIANVAKDYPGTNAARMAKLVIADERLANGCDQMFRDKAVAQQALNQAIQAYQAELRDSRGDMFHERATFGLARATEAKGEDLKAAEELYQKIVDKWPHGAFGQAAKHRLADLQRQEIKQLYDDFRNFNPKPTVPDEPVFSGPKPKFDESDMPKERPGEMPAPGDIKFGEGMKPTDKQPEPAKQPETSKKAEEEKK